MVMAFFKKVLKKDDEIELSHDEVLPWIAKKRDKAGKELTEYLNTQKESFDETILRSKTAIKELRDAELLNPQIPDEEKRAMQYYRVQYMTMLVRFLKPLEYPDNIDAIKAFHELFQGELDRLSQDSYEAYSVLKQFFSDKVENVVDVIKALDRIEKGLYSRFSESGISDMDEMMDEMKNTDNQEKAVAEDADIERLKKERDIIDAVLAEKNIKLHEVSDEGVADDVRGESLKRYIESTKDLQYVLKRYSEISKKYTEWIDSYVEDPVDTLRYDRTITLALILEGMLNIIDTLPIPEKRIPFLQAKLGGLSKEALTDARIALISSSDEEGVEAAQSPDIDKLKRDIADIEARRLELDNQLEILMQEQPSEKGNGIDRSVIDRINENLGANIRIVDK